MRNSNEYIRKKKFTSFEQFLRFSLLFFIHYLVIPQFGTLILMRQYGWEMTYLAFYWIVSIGIVIVGTLIVWKYYHWLAQLVAIPYLVFVGYQLTRYLIDQFWVLKPRMYIFHTILAIIVILNILYLLKANIMNLISVIKRNQRSVPTVSLRESKIFAIAMIFAISWTSLYFWSYIGFGDTITISDYEQPEFKFSFWGAPFSPMLIEDYLEPEGIAVLDKYQQLDATFYIHLSNNTLQNANRYGNYTECIKKFAEFDIDIIFDVQPVNRKYNRGDFVTQWYIQEMNESFNAVMNWIEAEQFTNIRGISFDVEGPKYDYLTNANETKLQPDIEQYYYALEVYQQMLDDFQERFPGKDTFLISMDGIIFDGLDGDYDLDIRAQTVGGELNWTYYGFMTYMVTSPDHPPRHDSYPYLKYLQMGRDQWGSKFLPWVGWWYDIDSIEAEHVYKMTMDQVKIAKSIGAEEVVLAPNRNYFGADFNEGMKRLDKLIDIKENGFEDFEILVTNNLWFFNDFPQYVEKIVPYYWIGNPNVFNDVLLSMDGYMLVPTIIYLSIVGLITFKLIASKNWLVEKKKIPLPNPALDKIKREYNL